MATRRGSRLVFLMAMATILMASLSAAAQFQVVRVINGNTIAVGSGYNSHALRLAGIDVPEVSHGRNDPGQTFNQEASRHLSDLVLGKFVVVREFEQDHYGHILGELFVDGQNVNLQMLRDGFAEVCRDASPPGLDLSSYWSAEENARYSKLGIRQQGDQYVSPTLWRKRMHEK